MFTMEMKLEMVNLTSGVANVTKVEVYRHAGDDQDGVESYFVLATCFLKGHEGGMVRETFTHKLFMRHGQSEAICNKLAAQVEKAGEINLERWQYTTPR